MTDPIRFIRDEFHRSVHGPAWHGPSLLEAISDVTAAEAAARPLEGTHNIAEIAQHALAWIEEVAHRLAGNEAALPQRGDWPRDVPWNGVRDAIIRASAALDREIQALAPARFDLTPQGAEFNAELGTGVSCGATLHGLAQHNAYHGGQVSLLKRALRG